MPRGYVAGLLRYNTIVQEKTTAECAEILMVTAGIVVRSFPRIHNLYIRFIKIVHIARDQRHLLCQRGCGEE